MRSGSRHRLACRMAELSVGCVMVTHNGARYLGEQLDSMINQTRPLDEVVLVDDHSTDESVEMVASALTDTAALRIVGAPTLPRHAGLYTRIAQNFAAGMAAAGTDIVILADQDDVWLSHRAAAHHAWFEAKPKCAMVAADGSLIDAQSRPTGATLRDEYPVPEAWATLAHAERMRYALAHPIATGAASAVMPDRILGGGSVPQGWLHDRWYSLSAVANDQMGVDPSVLVKYRTHGRQVVGMSGAADSSSPLRRSRRRLTQPLLAMKKFVDLSGLAMDSELGYRSSYMFPRSLGAALARGESGEQ